MVYNHVLLASCHHLLACIPASSLPACKLMDHSTYPSLALHVPLSFSIARVMEWKPSTSVPTRHVLNTLWEWMMLWLWLPDSVILGHPVMMFDACLMLYNLYNTYFQRFDPPSSLWPRLWGSCRCVMLWRALMFPTALYCVVIVMLMKNSSSGPMGLSFVSQSLHMLPIARARSQIFFMNHLWISTWLVT